jgi:hypothetical protein
VSVEIDSNPQGAEVIVDKKSLGKTPLRLSLPISTKPFAFDLKLSGYKRKSKSVIVDGNTVVNVPLDRLPTVEIQRQTPPKDAADSDLMRP